MPLLTFSVVFLYKQLASNTSIMLIQLESDFSPQEISLLNMHSVCNVLNVVQFELLRISQELGDIKALDQQAYAVRDLVKLMEHPDKAIGVVRQVEAFEDQVLELLESSIPEAEKTSDLVLGTLNNLKGIFQILTVRAKEIDARWDNPMRWVKFDADQLKQNFVDVFRAISANSHGAYHIVFNLAAHEEGDYLVNLEIDAKEGDDIWMPMIFQDVMRDLMANARKYTPPGGTISAGLYLDDQSLSFVVQDNGMGIPSADLQKVVQFGYRADNAKGRPTMGGGFGLSKAYYVTQLFGGTMEIDSPISDGRGTRIKLKLPRKGRV